MQTENNGVVAAEETNVAAEAKAGAVELHTPYHEALADLNQQEQPVAEAVAAGIEGQQPAAELSVLETEQAVLAPLVGESLDTPVTGEHLDAPLNSALEDAVTEPVTGELAEGSLAGVLEEGAPVVATSAAESEEAPAAQEEAASPAGKKKKTFIVPNAPFSVAKTVEGLEALKEFGFGEPFINSEEKRTIVFDIRTGLPIFDENFEGAWKEIEISGKLISITVLESEHKLVVISAVATETNTFYQFVKEHVFFNFVQRGTFVTPQEVVNALLSSNLSNGRKHYDASADVMEGFWYDLFKAVYQEQTIVNLTLKSSGGTKVPARLYFDPVEQSRCILSVGGVCFDYTLGEFPDRALDEGIKAYITEKKKAEEAQRERENKRGGRVVIKQKQERVRPSAIAQMKADTAPVLGYGRTPPAKPQPVAKTEEQRELDRQARQQQEAAAAETQAVAE